MKSSVSHTSDTRVTITITLDSKELDAAEQVALKKLSKATKVNGFRKGRAPLDMVKKNVESNTLIQETVENAISKAVAEAFLGNDIQALERPEVEMKKFVPGELMEFTAEAEVLPEVKLGDYRSLKVEERPISVSKKDIDEVLERIQKGFAEKKEVKEIAKSGDEVVIDFVGKKDGVVFDGGTGNDYPLVIGSQSFIPGFEEAIIGMKTGDKKNIELTFPKDYHVKNLAGQKVVFETTVKKVNQVILPEFTDEFAAKVGPFTSMAELKKDIKNEITAQQKREATDQMKDDLVKQLVAKSRVAVPAVLREDQIRSIEQDMQQNLMYQGITFDQYMTQKGYADRDAWIKGEAEEAANSRVKDGLVLAKLSKALKIEATADELVAHLNTYKKQYANNPEMAKHFDSPDAQREVANRLIVDKAIDVLVKLNSK